MSGRDPIQEILISESSFSNRRHKQEIGSIKGGRRVEAGV